MQQVVERARSLATLFAPRLAQHFGWASTFAIAMVPMAVVLLIFAFVRARVRVVTRLQHSRITLPFYGNPMAMRGMGNGAVFPLVPQRFPQRTGLVTGVVGAAGGLGGFLLPSLLGLVRA